MKRDVIVIGANANSVHDVAQLLRALPGDLPASVLAAVHIPADYPSILPNFTEDSVPLPVLAPKDKEKLRPGKVYMASPNVHLVVEGGGVRLYRSAQENLHRPAVDPLFRSAAYYYGPRVVGVLLSKSDSDGTSGLYSIKSKKGIVILRDPSEAHFPFMPFSVEHHVRPDYQLPLAEIPELLVRLAEGKERRGKEGGRPHAR